MKKYNKITVILLVMILTCVIAITASFSWLDRPNGTVENVNKLTLTDASAVIKSKNCTVETYQCDLVGGVLNDGTVVANGEVTIASGKTQYFKTVITNSSASKNNVSLVNLELEGATSATTVNILSPLKTSETYLVEGMMSLVNHLTVAESGTVTVEWYVCNKDSSTITVSNLPEISYYS